MSAAAQMQTIHLEPQYFQIVREVLADQLPGRAVWVFGSRATGHRLKPFSDLDLAVEGDLTISERGALTDAFEESLLPMKVDVVALASVAEDFAERIKPDLRLIAS